MTYVAVISGQVIVDNDKTFTPWMEEHIGRGGTVTRHTSPYEITDVIEDGYKWLIHLREYYHEDVILEFFNREDVILFKMRWA